MNFLQTPPQQTVDLAALIRSIQRTDGQDVCFDTGRRDCDKRTCPWRRYCQEGFDSGKSPAAAKAERFPPQPVVLKKILCTTDFSDLSNQAIPCAVDLARRFDATLYVCHVIDLPVSGTGEDVHLYPLAVQSERLKFAFEHLERLLQDQAVAWQPLITIGDPADEICRMARVMGVDLTVAASHGRSGWKRLILGSVTEQLMRLLPCPLLTVRGGTAGPDSDRRIQRILVGCDFSYDAGLAFQYGFCLAETYGAEIQLAHVIEPPVYRNLQKIARDKDPKSENDLRNFLKTELAGLVPQTSSQSGRLKTTLLEGQPFRELTRYAELQRTDLIVLGVRGRGLMETLWLGSTTDRVLRQAPCPVLTVRLPNHRADFSF